VHGAVVCFLGARVGGEERRRDVVGLARVGERDLAAYRERKISAAQLRQLLGYETRMEVDVFLKSHGVELEYTVEDIEQARDTHRQPGLSACRCK
jgi:hypothetical protein